MKSTGLSRREFLTTFSAAQGAALFLFSSHSWPVSEDQSPPLLIYVATDGNDVWSGQLATPNRKKTDGPFATLARARDVIRTLKKRRHKFKKPVIVMVRKGTYYLSEPLVLTPEDSGTPECPITYQAYPGEEPTLSGGRPITGWEKFTGHIWRAAIPAAKGGKWCFRQLFVDGERQILARYPNYDPKDPSKGGWLFVRNSPDWAGAFGAGVHSTETAGDWMEYGIIVPAAGDYNLWIRYAAQTQSSGLTDLDGRTAITLDTAEPVPLVNLPGTRDWDTWEWSPLPCARLRLTAGEQILRWSNIKGGGINLDAFVLTDDSNWKPAPGTDLRPPDGNKHLPVIQCEVPKKVHSKRMTFDKFASRTKIFLNPGTVKPWPLSPHKQVHIFPYWSWFSDILPVATIDEQGSKITLARGNADILVGNRFYVENVFEELDSPGEWYLDREAGFLYYWPRTQDFPRAEVVAPVLDRLIEFAGTDELPVSHLTIKGFAFRHTDYTDLKNVYYPSDAAVWLQRTQQCRIVNNRFLGVGGDAVCLKDGSSDNELVGNEVAYTGEGGIFLDGSAAESYDRPGPEHTRPRRNLISDNHIHDCGRVYAHVAGLYINHAQANVVSHNLITDMPRYGVSLKFQSTDNLIEYNEIRRTALETMDTGGIELYLNPGPNVVRFNLVTDVIGMTTSEEGKILSPYFNYGIYLDGQSSRVTVAGNIVVRNVAGRVFINSGHDNTIENNIFVDGSRRQVDYSNYDQKATGNKFFRNIVFYRNPRASLGHLGPPEGPSHLESDFNLFWHAESSISEFAELQKRGFDAHSIVADPLFVNASQDDYRLVPNSPAFKLGFEAIDTSRIGPRGRAADLEEPPLGQTPAK